jgi:hypothetical protein
VEDHRKSMLSNGGQHAFAATLHIFMFFDTSRESMAPAAGSSFGCLAWFGPALVVRNAVLFLVVILNEGT